MYVLTLNMNEISAMSMLRGSTIISDDLSFFNEIDLRVNPSFDHSRTIHNLKFHKKRYRPIFTSQGWIRSKIVEEPIYVYFLEAMDVDFVNWWVYKKYFPLLLKLRSATTITCVVVQLKKGKRSKQEILQSCVMCMCKKDD